MEFMIETGNKELGLNALDIVRIDVTKQPIYGEFGVYEGVAGLILERHTGQKMAVGAVIAVYDGAQRQRR